MKVDEIVYLRCRVLEVAPEGTWWCLELESIDRNRNHSDPDAGAIVRVRRLDHVVTAEQLAETARRGR